MNKTRKMVLLALFTTVALTIFIVEAQIPSFTSIAGIKLGLANCITLLVLLFWGWKEAGIVLIMRVILGCIFAGQAMTFFYSFVGGVFCLAAMQIVMPFFKKELCWMISVIGAVFHNIGQMLVAYVVVRNLSILVYLPILIISGIITGAFTGLCVQYLYRNKHIRKLFM